MPVFQLTWILNEYGRMDWTKAYVINYADSYIDPISDETPFSNSESPISKETVSFHILEILHVPIGHNKTSDIIVMYRIEIHMLAPC